MLIFSLVTTVASDKYRMVRITVIEGSMAIGNMLGSFTSGAILDHSIGLLFSLHTTVLSYF